MRPGVGCICRALARREGRPRASRTWANRKPRANTWSEGQMAVSRREGGTEFPSVSRQIRVPAGGMNPLSITADFTSVQHGISIQVHWKPVCLG